MLPCAIVIADRSRAGKILSSPRQRAPFAYLVSFGGSVERVPAGFRNVVKGIRLVFEDAASQEEARGTSWTPCDTSSAFIRSRGRTAACSSLPTRC
jgi:hypothetical protein